MSELANISGVSVGQIYRFFTGKSDLIRAIIREDASARISNMRRIAADLQAGLSSLEAALQRIFLDALTTGDEALSFDILAEAHRDANVAATITEMCMEARLIIGSFIVAAHPTATQQELDSAQEMILALMFGLGHRALSRSGLSNEEVAQSTAALIHASLMAIRTRE